MKLILLALLGSSIIAFAEKPQTENRDWEQACGGSNIAVTSVAGKIVCIDAFVEHFAEGRQWVCHFKGGEIISALFRHFKVIRKSAGEAGEFTTELDEDRTEVFHFPDHDLSKMDPDLKKDLLEVIAKATKPGEQGGAGQSGAGSESR
ncbi:hypothetical protein [Prosthecobacter dejongeii]|uniref:Uncharacterized protein n=1 Tax=Prosthecobacter dejongeii TaxID=48465 RepID=A0A7W7YGX3_9BACT|nr:hypothetical protein [Prosthecobacter dejongeii]MBB5035787.1 hypothetical protein [Prosthecobacter dejongeii]